jgi:hypothetical protein
VFVLSLASYEDKCVDKHLADVAVSREDATWPTCMLLCRRACCYSGACGAPRDKFRGQKCIFKVKGPAVLHMISLGGQKYIFKVQGPM